VSLFDVGEATSASHATHVAITTKTLMNERTFYTVQTETRQHRIL